GALGASPARAQAIAFDLPSLPLSEALLRVGGAAGLEIGFSPEAIEGLAAPPLRGRYEPYEAIDRLLADTGLVADTLAPGVLVIGRAPPQAPDIPPAAEPSPVETAPPPAPPRPPSSSPAAPPDRIVVTGSHTTRD